MPFVLLFIGVLLVTVAIRDQQQPFVALLGDEFSGPRNFLYWVVALIVIGSIGYIPKAKPVANAMLALIIIVLFLKRGDPSQATGGVFQQLQAALSTTKTPSAAGLAGSSFPQTSSVSSVVSGLTGGGQ